MSIADLGLNKNLYKEASTSSVSGGPFVLGELKPQDTIEPGTIIQGTVIRNFTQQNDVSSETGGENLQIGQDAIIRFNRPAPSYSLESGDFSFPTLFMSPTGIVFGDPDQANVYAGGFFPVGNLPYGGVPAFPNQNGVVYFGPNGEQVLRIGDINPTINVTYGFLVANYPFFKAHPSSGIQGFQQPITLGYGRVNAAGTINSTTSSPLWTCTQLATGVYEFTYIGSPFPVLYDFNVLVTPEDNFSPVVAQVRNRTLGGFIVDTYDLTGTPVDSQFSFHVYSKE